MDHFIIALASASLTPVIMVLWASLSPVKSVSGFEPSFHVLNRRYGIINSIACILSFVGICIPLPLMRQLPEGLHMWALGLGFGSMIILPLLFITLVTLPFGFTRFYEFWRFYELKYKIGIRGIMTIYIPLMLLGLVSTYQVFAGL